MPRLPWLTLARFFFLATLAIVLVVGAMFLGLMESSRRSVLSRSDELREAAARRIDDQLSSVLAEAATTIDDVERATRFGALDPGDPAAVEARLFSEVLDRPTLSDVTLTHGTLLGYDPDGEARLAPGDRWQVSVFRASADPRSPVHTRRVVMDGPAFYTDMRRRERDGALLSAPFVREPLTADPTLHPTFSTTVSRRNYGKAIWSDLSFSELDAALPQSERRVVVTVQRAVVDRTDRFAGVLRVGLLARTIDALPRLRTGDAERVFLCDAQGRLVARLDPSDRVEESGDDLRMLSSRVPSEIRAALGQAGRSGALVDGGVRYLLTFRSLADSQGWMVGVLVPEDFYTRDLRAIRDRFLSGFLATTAVALAGGWLLLGHVRRALARVVDTAGRMRSFDFSATPASSPLREVAEIVDGLERAKTSVRALGKYVPIDLVRELYGANREPELGGELLEISLMFTDIEGFTTLSERLAPGELARALGRYLEAMTAGVRSTQGTVDKFIGDAVMAFWNAPTRCEDHARRACRAVLACRRATRVLYASKGWTLAPLVTRFGVHTARVMVGHFGSPERVSYTALGDGVNLAARLEGLCKQYGLQVLASEATMRAAAEDDLVFRFVDKVAVKGKSEAIRVYELLGERDECAAQMPTVHAYERALDAYFARDFANAAQALRAVADDPPSRVLAERCEALILRPPPEDWDGVYVATRK